MTRVEQDKSISQREAGKEMLAQVRFGMLSKKCRSYGICEVKKIEKASRSTERTQRKMICNVELINDRQLKCAFEVDSITEKGRLKYFGKGYFKMGEAYKIPAYISTYFGINAVAIRPGKYSITEEQESKIVVLFDLDHIISKEQ